MNLVIERAAALSALSRATAIVERAQIAPILGNVLLSTTEDGVMIRSTDLNMEIVERFPAEVGEGGSTTLPADKLHDIVRNAEAGSQIIVKPIKDEKHRLSLLSGRSRFTVPTLPAEDFPEFPADDLGAPFSFSAKTLADMLSRVAYAAAPAALLTAATCVCLTTWQDQLHAVAASTGGIALRREPKPEGAEVLALLPAKLTARIIRWLGDAEGDVTVTCAYPNEGRPASLIRLEHVGSTLTARCFDAPEYYDYMGQHLIEDHEAFARTDQDGLSAALKRVLVMRDDKSNAVRLAFDEGGVTVAARNAALGGEGTDELAAEYEGEAHDFLLDSGRLQETLGVLRGDVVEFGFSLKPDPRDVTTAKVICRAPSDPGFVSIIMRRVA